MSKIQSLLLQLRNFFFFFFSNIPCLKYIGFSLFLGGRFWNYISQKLQCFQMHFMMFSAAQSANFYFFKLTMVT